MPIDQTDLGRNAIDTTTGFEGVITAVAYHLTGCRRIQLTGSSDGSRPAHEDFFYEAEVRLRDDGDVDVDPQTETDVKLGHYVRDTVTNVEGYVIVRTFELYNCPSVAIQPIEGTDTTTELDSVWADVPRVEVVRETPRNDEFDDLIESDDAPTTGSTVASLNQTQSKPP